MRRHVVVAFVRVPPGSPVALRNDGRQEGLHVVTHVAIAILVDGEGCAGVLDWRVAGRETRLLNGSELKMRGGSRGFVIAMEHICFLPPLC